MVLSNSKGGKGTSLLKTAEDYASHTTIHGVSYAFDKDLSVLGRILWALIVVALLALATYLTFNTWEDWRDDQVIPFHALSSFKPFMSKVVTTLKSSSHPIENISFPTITICGSGLNMNNVERAVAESFARWRIETGRNESSEHKISEDMADYMMEAFQINTKSSEVANILDLLNTFVASDVEETVSQNGVRDNAIHCAENDIIPIIPAESTQFRKKREALLTQDFCCEEMLMTADIEALHVPSNLISEHKYWTGHGPFSFSKLEANG